MVRPILAIAANTIREALRARILYVLLLFAAGLILFSLVLSNLSLGYRARMVTDISLSTTTVIGYVVTILLGATSVGRELATRTALYQLTRANDRTTYVLGRFLGVVATSWMVSLLLAALATFAIAFYQHRDPFQYAAGDYALTVFFLLLRLSIVAAIATALSASVSVTVAMIASFGIVIAGHTLAELRNLVSQGTGEGQAAVELLRRIVPDLSSLDLLPLLVHDGDFTAIAVGWSAIYTVLYCGIAMAIAALAFRKRDLT